MSTKMKTALSIAGSDSSGGAGIQADMKTMSAHGVYAMTAITALTAQNTTGVTGILESTPEFLAAQLDAVFTDIFPDAVKIGMVSNAALIRVIAQKLKQYGAKHIVVDPVMVLIRSKPSCCPWRRLLRPTSLKRKSSPAWRFVPPPTWKRRLSSSRKTIPAPSCSKVGMT